MTATHALPPEVGEYIAAVRRELADLPDAERDDILVDVEASVADTASEHGGSIAARLGHPTDFAAELRAAAGLAPPPTPLVDDEPRGWRTAVAALAADPRVAALRRLGSELAPIWWLVRAYVAVAALGLATGVAWTGAPPLVPRFGDSTNGGLAVIALAVAASVALGLLAGRRRLTAAVVALNVALLAAAVPVAQHLGEGAGPADVVYVTITPQDLTYHGSPVENIYPYSRDGRLLHDVLLYDAAGTPIEVRGGSADPLRRVLTARNGARLFNSFPIRYFEPGTRTVARPNAGPSVRVPRVAGRPLAARRAR